MISLRRLLGAASIVTTVVWSGCTQEQVYSVEGVIRSELENDRVVIEHAEIPDYMPAMTMAFTVADENRAGLRRGDRVRFRYRVSEMRSLADEFEVLGQEAAAPAVAPAPAPRRLREGDPLSPLRMINERGEPITGESFQGRWTVLTFIFTRCPVPEFCPAMAARFGQLQQAFAAEGRADARLLSLTLDPEFDRPDILRMYGEAVGADPRRWNFATGTADEMTRLARSFAVYAERNGVTLDHTLCTALINPEGRVAAIWRGHGWKAAEVLAALPPPATP